MSAQSPTDAELQPLVAEAFLALADALADLPEKCWDEPSLCAGWAVRNVIAHLTMAARYDADAFRAELAADGFDFQTMSDRIAVRDAVAAPTSLLADLRRDTMATFPQPGGGFAGSLMHVVIHGLDVTVPLGIGRVFSDAATTIVLDGLASSGPQTMFGVDTAGLALHATDLDWCSGSGRTMNASAADLLVHLAGRTHVAPQ